MASPGYAALGNAIAGGNVMTGALAYDQGQMLGARTMDALSAARQRVDETTAREGIDAKLAPLVTDPKVRAAMVGAIQAGVDPQQVFNSIGTNQKTDFRNQIVDPTTSDPDVARRLLALGQNASIIAPAGTGQITNRLHPDQGVQTTPLGAQLAQVGIAQKNASINAENAEAAMREDQMAHPEKYRYGILPSGLGGPTYDGSTPLPNGANEATIRQMALNHMPAPSPGSRNYNTLGGEAMVRRLSWLAAHPDAITAPLPGAPAAPVAPPSGAAPATAPTANTDSSGIALPPTAKPTQAPGFSTAFNANNFNANKTVLNDLSRKSGTGGNDDALNRTAGHLDVYEQLMKNSANTNFVAGNKLKNWFQQQTGQAWPGNAQLAAHVLGTEIVKSMTSIGAGTGEERGGLAGAFQNANSVPQAEGAIDTAQRLLREQAVATNQRVSANGVQDYYSKYLTPTTRRRLGLGEFAAPAPGAANAAPSAAAGGGTDLAALALAELKRRQGAGNGGS